LKFNTAKSLWHERKLKSKNQIAKLQIKNSKWIPALAGMTEGEIAALGFASLAMTVWVI